MIEALEIGPADRPRLRSDPTMNVTYLDRRPWKLPNLVVWNIDDLPLPFNDGEFDLIYAYQVLEHSTRFPDLMDDLHRILKPSGSLHVEVPHMDWEMRLGPVPTHYRLFTQETFKRYEELDYVKRWHVVSLRTTRLYDMILENEGGGKIIENPKLRNVIRLLVRAPHLLDKCEIRAVLKPA